MIVARCAIRHFLRTHVIAGAVGEASARRQKVGHSAGMLALARKRCRGAYDKTDLEKMFLQGCKLWHRDTSQAFFADRCHSIP